MTMNEGSEAVLAALTTRRSVRAFLDEPVSRPTLEQILTASARAASGNNIQPWRVRVLTGDAKQRLTTAIMAVRESATSEPTPEYQYYPVVWPEPYLSRRRAVGWRLYELLGIQKGDRAAARAWHDQNFAFFNAPVGMIFTIDRRLGLGAYIDIGMYLQNVMIAARGLGLDTCPQAAFAGYHEVIRRELALSPEEMVVCGMALGRADTASVSDRMSTDREDVQVFASFLE
jgi:nitroreductase